MCPGAFPGGELQLLLRGSTLCSILLRGGADEVVASRSLTGSCSLFLEMHFDKGAAWLRLGFRRPELSALY